MSALTRRQLLARGAASAAGAALAGSGLAPLASAAAASAAPGSAARASAPAAASQAAAAPPVPDGAAAAVASYLAFMDTVMERLLGEWSPAFSSYRAPGGTYATVINARMLQVHAGAALAGHEGASRDDDRARALTARLLQSPAPWRTSGAGVPHEKMFHLPGWTTSLTDPDAVMDKAVDPQVAQALVAAWRARTALGLEATTVQAVVQAVSAVARCAFFRYPGIRLNQLNWNCALYALDAELTGATDLLRGDYRAQMLRFATYATRAEHQGGCPNLGPGWHFDYLPNHDPASMANLDAPEYANEVLDCVRHYDTALTAGMEPLPNAAIEVFRAYARRTLYGDWTHAGYLNWDTGLGAQRRYIGKVFAFAQQGLMSMATSPVVQSVPGMAGHAHWLFERGLDLYLRLLSQMPVGAVPPAVQFGEDSHPEGPDDRLLFAARMASNAAQAVQLDLAAVPSTEPPPMYSFDPDSQRLAVSTPRYSTAILVHNRGAVPYGGLELCRLFDARQVPVACTGGTGLANFIASIHDGRGRVLLDTQTGGGAPSGAPPIAGGRQASMSVVAAQSDGSIRRVGPASAPYPLEAYAGPMRGITAGGRVAQGAAAIATSHELLPETIALNWLFTLPRGAGWEVALPSYGPQASFIVTRPTEPGGGAELTPGAPGAPGAPGVALARARSILVRSEQGSYTIEALTVPRGAQLRVVPPTAGTGAARPGPTLLITGGPAADRRAGTVRLALRLAVH